MAAEKAPDTIETVRLGTFAVTICTWSTTNIDDNDYWTSGIKSKIGQFFGATIDNADISIDDYSTSTGLMTFGSTANWVGSMIIFHRGY